MAATAPVVARVPRVHVLVLGAAGMLRRKLSERLARDGALGGEPIERLSLADVVAPQAPAIATFAVDTTAADITHSGAAGQLLHARPQVVFHLAAVVSGE